MSLAIWLTIISVGIAAVSLIISIFNMLINKAYNHLKEDPFFIMIGREYESEYHIEDYVNPYTYNFVYADEYSDYLGELKNKNKYRKELSINKNNSYVELENCGGKGKNIIIITEVIMPSSLKLEDQFSSSFYSHGWKQITKESNDGSYFTISENGGNGRRHSELFKFHEGIRITKKYKGIPAGGKLKYKLPKEFIFFTNLYHLDVIQELPVVKVTIKGQNTLNKNFEDIMEIKMDTLNDKFDSEKRYLKISLMSQLPEDNK